MTSTPYNIVVSDDTLEKIVLYKAEIDAGTVQAGARLKAKIKPGMDRDSFIEALLATKLPKIFAESEIKGDDSDWNARELSILGDINVTMEADIHDNGTWSVTDKSFKMHQPPLRGHLLFTPGALLKGSGFTGTTPDLAEIQDAKGSIDQNKYNRLVERRLLPLFLHAESTAATEGRPAFVTLPGIGCGVFAGDFKGEMGEYLNIALKTLLQKHGGRLPHIAAVYFDPFSECVNEEEKFHGVSYFARPSTFNPGQPQLCAPGSYKTSGKDFSTCTLYKIVAWDHASLPGNDFFGGSRHTDDGVTAAATNAMEVLMGVKGRYTKGAYAPPAGFRTWEEIALKNKFNLAVKENVKIFPLNPPPKITSRFPPASPPDLP
jgi:hypothetical protein